MLAGLRQHFAHTPQAGCIFLAGDSSLDNKHWLQHEPRVGAVNGYERILVPPRMVQDVAFHINDRCSETLLPWFAVNCAVEESTIAERRRALQPHDEVGVFAIQPPGCMCVSQLVCSLCATI